MALETRSVFDAADISFSGMGGTPPAEALMIYMDTGMASDEELAIFEDAPASGSPATPNGEYVDIIWSASGIFAI